MQTVWFLLAAIAGGALGFWLKSSSTKAEKRLLEQRNLELLAELTGAKDALDRSKAESESRASFEALASERQLAVGRLEEERNALREELNAKANAEPAQAARISQLEADLRNANRNLLDQEGLYETTKQNLIAERTETVRQLEEERQTLREDLHAKTSTENMQTARISQLETDLRNVGQNLADQVALLESTKQALNAERAETVTRLENERNALREEVRIKNETDRDQSVLISRLEAELKNERENLAEKLAILDNAKQALATQFQALAGEILDTKSRAFSETNKSELGTLLDPLKTQITEFRAKVEEAQKESLVGRTELSSELKQLKSLNEKLSSEAHSLSMALRQDTQKQGFWGEKILLLILEKSGFLQKGIHYTYQENFVEVAEDGQTNQNRRTDVVVKLPEGRHLIIDSKVSIKDYIDSTTAENEDDRTAAIKRHLDSMRKHYKGLAARSYPRLPGLQSPDFVVMFVPVEPAFMLAVQQDETLWTEAYQNGVLLAGPTTVLFVIRIVENLWRQEQQAKNVQKVMDRGEKLYDKFVGFVEDLQAVGQSISDADQSYKEAFKKLTSGRENLVRQVEMLRELGLEPKKKLKPKLLESAGADEILPFLAAEAETVRELPPNLPDPQILPSSAST